MALGTSHHNKALLGFNNTNDLLTDSMESDQSLVHTSTNLHHHHHQHHTVHSQSTNLKHHMNKEAADATAKNDNNLSEFPPSPTESHSNINQNQHDSDKSSEFTKFNDNDDGVTDRSYNVNSDSDSDDVFHTTISEDDYVKENDKNASINLVNLFDKSKKSFSANDSIYLANSRLLTVDELATLKSKAKSFSHGDLLKKDFRNGVQTETDEKEDECTECVISDVVAGRNMSQKYENYDNKAMDTVIGSELHIRMGNSETTSNSLPNNINGITHKMDNDISSTTATKAAMGETRTFVSIPFVMFLLKKKKNFVLSFLKHFE